MPSRPSTAFSFALAVAVPLAACQEKGSSVPVASPATTTNLGIAIESISAAGSVRLALVPESEQGVDLDGDGDEFDRVVHVVDLGQGRVINTGRALGIIPGHGSEIPPRRVEAAGPPLAFGVSESETGGLDRNADGDAHDIVLAYFEQRSAQVVELGLAASFVTATQDLLAFDVPEFDQGQDLDGWPCSTCSRARTSVSPSPSPSGSRART